MPIEVALVIAIALVPWPQGIPVGIPLVVAASVMRWLRGRSFAELFHGGALHAGVGALAGLVALGTALVAATPMVEALAARAVEWSMFPIVRGSASQLGVVLMLVGIGALCAELAFRGWLVERVLELSPGPPYLPVLLGALAEAIVTPGDVAMRLGAGLFGAGLGWMYVAGNRSVVGPVLARITFVCGAVVLEAFKLIG